MNWIGIAGPTASGKTAAALAIAELRPVEIVSVDSALVYRGMDIGTAKPTPAERAAVPHHLINIRDPLQAYSAAEFVADAKRLVSDIRTRGKLPLLVGGTMLYFKALMDGIDDMPRSDAGIRAQVDAEAAQRGWPAMHAELMAVDPTTAARLAPHDAQRIQRALEVHRISGQPLSSFHTARTGRLEARAETGALLVSLEPQNRAWLHQRIAERFDAMLAAGFVDEVRALRARGDLDPALASMRCVGYRQAWDMLDASANPSAVQLAEMREKGIAATRQLAKRQLTWLRSMPHRRVVACDAPDAVQRVVDLVLYA